MLWYGLTKTEVLEQVYPDEVQFLLDKAKRFAALRLAEEVQAIHTNEPAALFRRLVEQGEHKAPAKVSFAEGLARLAELRADLGTKEVGDTDLARRIRLHERAWRYVRGNRGRRTDA